MAYKIGLIVDGEGDIASLKKKFSNTFQILKTDGPRGHTASPEKIIAKGRKQISMLRSLKCKKVIMLLDLENRSISYEELKKTLVEEAKKQDLGIEIGFAIPNKMIENWYLADLCILSSKKVYIKDNLKQRNYEGTNGKKELKNLFKKGHNYSETIHGPQLFELIRDKVAIKNSQSYKDFLFQIEVLTT